MEAAAAAVLGCGGIGGQGGAQSGRQELESQLAAAAMHRPGLGRLRSLPTASDEGVWLRGQQ